MEEACLDRLAAQRGLVLDPFQRAAVLHLQRLHDELGGFVGSSPMRLLRRWLRPRPVRGVYLWGGVGRGKSLLMDTFFSCIPIVAKRRAHYHRFMQEIHGRLAMCRGESDPLARVARELARQVRLLCLDEFHITDITDAMLMAGLLKGLLDQGVTLVITSNSAPQDLYRNGLQRTRFLPTIALIRGRLDVVHLDGGEDYRLGTLEQAGLYHAPLGDAAEAALSGIFHRLTDAEACAECSISLAGRAVAARGVGSGVAWFDFARLCGGPRSQSDYIELAGRFHTLLLSNVPQLSGESAAHAKRFLWLVDEFYDRRVKLVLSAAVPLADLCPEPLFDGDFRRVLSRLREMQSHAYLAQPHQSF